MLDVGTGAGFFAILFGEMGANAKKNANRIALRHAYPVRFMMIVLKPLIWVVVKLIELITKGLPDQKDESSDEYCEVCGRQMVVKKGKFGHFLACPGFPECTFTKPIVIEMPGKCPKCGHQSLKSRRINAVIVGYKY